MEAESDIARALAHHQAGRLSDAASLYRQVLQTAPQHVDALHLLGLVEKSLGHLDSARALIQQACDLAPHTASFHISLADVCYALQDFVAAEAACRAAITLEAQAATAYNHLGVMLKAQQRWQDAECAYRQALSLDANYAEAHSNLGNVLKTQGRSSEAEQHYRSALAINPDAAATWNNLGNVLQQGQRWEEAEYAYREALRRAPELAEASYNLGLCLAETQRLEDAISAQAQALQYDFNNSAALDELVHLMLRGCIWEGLPGLTEELLGRFRAGRADMNPYSLLDLPASPQEQLDCARRNAQKILAGTARTFTHTPHRPAAPRLRIGYISYDFRPHPVAFLIAELFALHDRSQFEVFAFSIGPSAPNAMREHFQKTAEHFVDLASLSHDAAAQIIFDAHIDILVDLTGYTTGSRTEILAQRPAPIQVNWLGYPATMGAPFIDYLIADAQIIPDRYRQFYSEAVVRSPQCYQINDRHRSAEPATPTRGECGLPEAGFVFVCFNHTHKITPQIFEIWMRLLRATPGSALWLLESNALAATQLRQAAQRYGLSPERLVFAPRMPQAQHLARYRLADLALDTFPYTSHTTASDALWMGCPLLTCMGATFAARVAGSLLHAVGLPELATNNFTEYENLALALASDHARLATLKNHLHQKRMTLPLFDSPARVQELESVYLRMAEIWRKDEAPQGFDLP